METIESESQLNISIFGHSPCCKNLAEIFVNCYFSDFEPTFLLFGGVCSKSAFSKKKFFLREDFFETTLDLNKHPQQVF